MVFYLKRIFTPFLHEQSLINYHSWEGSTDVVRVSNALRCFAIAHFPGLMSEMKSEESQKEFLLYLKIILFSHRYQKSQAYLKLNDDNASYDIIRDPMYKYSQTSQDNFFKVPCLAFIFMWYATNPDAQDFSQKRYVLNPNPEYAEKMKKVIQQLNLEAYRSLRVQTAGIDPEFTILKTVEVADSKEAQDIIVKRYIPTEPIEHELQLHDKMGLRRPFKTQEEYVKDSKAKLDW